MNTMLVMLALLGASAPSNLELAEEALVMACMPIPDSLAAAGAESVILQLDGTHEGGWFVIQTLTSLLDQRGIQVTDMPEERNPGLVLRVRPMELLVGYGDVSRPWIVGAKRVERLATAEISSQLVDGDGTVLMTLRTSGSASDRIAWGDAESLSGSDEWGWLSADLPEGGGGGILEPIIVTGVVASLVYLFYSSRAD